MEAAELSKVLDAGGNSGLGRLFSAARMRTIERRLRKLEQIIHSRLPSYGSISRTKRNCGLRLPSGKLYVFELSKTFQVLIAERRSA